MGHFPWSQGQVRKNGNRRTVEPPAARATNLIAGELTRFRAGLGVRRRVPESRLRWKYEFPTLRLMQERQSFSYASPAITRVKRKRGQSRVALLLTGLAQVRACRKVRCSVNRKTCRVSSYTAPRGKTVPDACMKLAATISVVRSDR